MIKVTHLTKKYGDRVAVNDISFEMKEHRVIGFLGPNGAGKSTTMNMITGYIAPDRGSVFINDISLMKNPQKAKSQIGYLPEIPPVYLDMTVMEYLVFVAELKKVAKYERKKEVERVLKLTRTEGVKDRLIRNLSKGYKQRIGIAQALVADPEILILDEPTVGLDPKQIVEVRNLIKSLGKNHTVILSTHILSEVEAVCDEIIIISRGHVVAQDDPEKLVRSFNENMEITMVLRENSTRVENVLKQLGFIDSYKMLSEKNGKTKIQIICKPISKSELEIGKEKKQKLDYRELLVNAFGEKGIMILELAVHEASLEDVYLKLTNDTYLDTVYEDDEVDYEDNEDDEEEE